VATIATTPPKVAIEIETIFNEARAITIPIIPIPSPISTKS